MIDLMLKSIALQIAGKSSQKVNSASEVYNVSVNFGHVVKER